MPSDIRYARAAMARRSPNARLYSGVPRSSQWPSIVTYQLVYFFNAEAFAFRTAWPSALTSLLSSSKNTGLSGELRLRSSSEADAMVSSLTGSGGTTMGSATGSGGAGGRAAEGAAAFAVVGGGGAGRATGAFLPPHAAATSATKISTHCAAWEAADRVDIVRSISLSPAEEPVNKSRSTQRPRRPRRRNTQRFLGVLGELGVQTSHFFIILKTTGCGTSRADSC